MMKTISQNLATRQPTLIRSVGRAARLLAHVAQDEQGCSAKACADALGLPLATAHHLLSTLVSEGLLTKDLQRRYHLGPQVGALADAFRRQLVLDERLVTPLRRLAEATSETAHAAAWRHGEVVVLACIEGVQAVRVAMLHTGLAGGGHARASGKLLLALAGAGLRDGYLERHPLERYTERTICGRAELEREFERIRVDGYAVDDEEFAPGVACVAAPIVVDGTAVGAYSLSAPLARFRERRRWLTEAVQDAARAGAVALSGAERDAR